MKTVRVQFDSGDINETLATYGLMYFTSDNRYAAPIKDFEKTSYPEQSGENLYPVTTDDAFDYEIEFFVGAESGIDNANYTITAFNALMYTEESLEIDTGEEEDIPAYMPTLTKQFKQITLYNDVKGVKIVGYPSPLETANDYWYDSKGAESDKVTVTLKIRVSDPSLCDFNISRGNE